MQINAINSYNSQIKRNYTNNKMMSQPSSVAFEGRKENDNNQLVTIPKGLLKAMILSAAISGPTLLNQSCQKDDYYEMKIDQMTDLDLDIVINGSNNNTGKDTIIIHEPGKTDTIFKTDTIIKEVPGKVEHDTIIQHDTAYIEIPGKTDTVEVKIPLYYRPEVNDSLISKIEQLGFVPEGEGDLIGALTGKLDWEYNADWTSTIDADGSSNKQMAFTDVSIKLDGEVKQGRMKFALSEPINQAGENGKLILVELQAPVESDKKPQNELWWTTTEKLLLGAVKNGKMPIYKYDDNYDLLKIGEAYKYDNALVLSMLNGKFTSIDNFKIHMVDSKIND